MDDDTRQLTGWRLSTEIVVADVNVLLCIVVLTAIRVSGDSVFTTTTVAVAVDDEVDVVLQQRLTNQSARICQAAVPMTAKAGPGVGSRTITRPIIPGTRSRNAGVEIGDDVADGIFNLINVCIGATIIPIGVYRPGILDTFSTSRPPFATTRPSLEDVSGVGLGQ